MAKPDPAIPAPRPARTRHALRYGLALTSAALVACIAAGWMLISAQSGVDWLVAELVTRSGGALEVEGATGSLVDTVRVRRIAWRGPTATVIATDVALTWRPSALLSRGIVVEGLGTQQLSLEFTGQPDTVLALPDSLSLPIDVTIERLGVARLHWRAGSRQGSITGLEFGYTGGAREHRISGLTLVTNLGVLTGAATIGGRTPFPIDGTFAFAAEAARKDARIDVVAAGTLATLAIDARGRAGAAGGTAHATLAPLAAVPLHELYVDLRDVDLAKWDPALPATRLTLVARGKPIDGGISGTFDTTNTLAGPVDAGKMPLRASAGRFAWRAESLALDGIDAELVGGGRATGRARIPLGGAFAGGVVARGARHRSTPNLRAARRN